MSNQNILNLETLTTQNCAIQPSYCRDLILPNCLQNSFSAARMTKMMKIFKGDNSQY